MSFHIATIPHQMERRFQRFIFTRADTCNSLQSWIHTLHAPRRPCQQAFYFFQKGLTDSSQRGSFFLLAKRKLLLRNPAFNYLIHLFFSQTSTPSSSLGTTPERFFYKVSYLSYHQPCNHIISFNIMQNPSFPSFFSLSSNHYQFTHHTVFQPPKICPKSPHKAEKPHKMVHSIPKKRFQC